ncbi:MAG TPA: cation:proton antiporter, partial [Alphaproteobacteria bacterium]
MDHTDALSQIALILAIAFAGEVILRRLRQPALVGYIIAGILMGPSMLGVIQHEEQVSFLAELGILLLLFIVGLELDLAKFAK